ncbi:MAG TPA: DUF1801 domain-containing protein [Pyrinomonadaceae bacterium]
MAKSDAATVEEYLEGLPEERREVVSRVREVILSNLPRGYRESMNWGMIAYEVPLEKYPDTYNKQPLGYAALGAQKNYISLHLMCAYQDSELEKKLKEGFAKAGKKLDMGKSCIRFKKLEDIPLEVIGEAVASTPPEKFIEQYEKGRHK